MIFFFQIFGSPKRCEHALCHQKIEKKNIGLAKVQKWFVILVVLKHPFEGLMILIYNL